MPLRSTIAVLSLLALAVGPLCAQEPAAPQAALERAPVTLQVRVVLSRSQGEKKISSLPFSLSVNADGRSAQLRLGAQVPVPTARAPQPSHPDAPPMPPAGITYRPVGIEIDCSALALDDGRFRVTLTISDSSVYPAEQSDAAPAKGASAPVFRSFRSSNMLVLRDGESREFTSAADRLSGEVVRAEVSINVPK